MRSFRDRAAAGRELAAKLAHHRDSPLVLILGLPRGGVPVAFEVAQALHAPLDVFLVRKLGVPGHEELAMGAIANGSVCVLNNEVIRELAIARHALDEIVEDERRELRRRERAYRGNRRPPDPRGQIAILVDDGLATGSTMRAAVAALRRQGPARIVVAAPVGALSTCAELESQADEVICVRKPHPFRAVGRWYRDFVQISDEEVRELLARAGNDHAQFLDAQGRSLRLRTKTG
jgi:predicted phosphoribosyltransferase